RDVDEPRAERAGRLPAQAQPLHDPGAEVLDEDVGAGNQLLRDRLAVGPLQVEGEAPLVAVRGHEEDGEAALVEVAPRPVALPELAARRLDLDDVGPEIRQELDARRPQQELGERQDANTLENREWRPLVHDFRSWRAMTRRWISLVPSQIWYTR